MSTIVTDLPPGGAERNRPAGSTPASGSSPAAPAAPPVPNAASEPAPAPLDAPFASGVGREVADSLSPIGPPPRKRSWLDLVWAIVALVAVGFSFQILYRELLDMARQELGEGAALPPGDVLNNLGVFARVVWDKVTALPVSRVLLAVGGTLVAYAALAAYDRLALDHLYKRGVSWLYVTLCSFVTYALAHNIGASAFTGAVVRYRAYTAKGLSAPEVAVLVAFCSFTFLYGTLVLAGLVLAFEPEIVQRVADVPVGVTRAAGIAILLACAAYVGASLLRLRPLVIRGFRLEYPRPAITIQQVFIAPLEICGAAAIIYFALPAEGNPGYFIVLGVFLLSFSAALASHAPGGLGVLEAVFLLALPELPKGDVLAALVVFRLFYLLIPLGLSIPVVLAFERLRLKGRIAPTAAEAGASPAAGRA